MKASVKKKSDKVFSQLIRNAYTSRQEWIRSVMDTSRKDIDKECGHPTDVTIDEYVTAFQRGDVAARVVAIFPEECWGNDPIIYETEDEDVTEFEKVWEEVEKKLSLNAFLQRADVLSGIGRYGVLLLGLSDGRSLREPVEGIDEKGNAIGNVKHELLFVRPFDESLVQINSFETDMANPRFGQPTSYTIQFVDTTTGIAPDSQGQSVSTVTVSSQVVHWTRIIHLADNRTNSEIYGEPRMKRVWNRLLDLKKVAGGAGEMFWKGGFPGLSIEATPTEGDVEIDEDATKEQMEAYMDGLQRYIATTGMTVKSLAIQIADPRPHIEIQIRLIAMGIGVPWRILMGVEVGQLASQQDIRVWNRRLQRRREQYVNPFVIRPLIERLVAFGVLPRPSTILIDWPDLNSPTDEDRATVAEKRTNALAKYATTGVDALVPPLYYLTLILGMSDAEAAAIIASAGERVDELGPPEPVTPPAST